MLSHVELLQKAAHACKSFSDKTYKFETPAEALLFAEHDKALRVEAPFIGKEFTDGLFIGSDPSGLLQYNAIRDLDNDREVKYRIDRKVEGDDTYIWIRFYKEKLSSCHAEFFALDRRGALAATGMAGYENHGKWKDLNICSATSLVDKRTDESVITIKVPGIDKNADMPAPPELARAEFRMQGTLWFKKLKDINNGHYASYNSDRIVFMQSDLMSTDFTAYFIRTYRHQQKCGID